MANKTSIGRGVTPARNGDTGPGERVVNILESMTDGFVAYDRQWRYTYVNRQAEVVLRRKREELLGKVVWEEYPRLLGTQFETQCRQAVEKMVGGQFEQYYPPSDRWFEAHVYPSDEGACVYFRDITERRRRERQLSESEDRFRLLAETTLAVPWEYDPVDLRFTYVGPQAESLLGYPLADWYEQGFWSNHIHPADRERSVVECERAADERRDHVMEYRMLAAGGQMVWIKDIVHVVAEGERCVSLRGFMLDVTERKRVEEALRESEARYRTLIEQASDGIFVADPEGNYLDANESGLKMLGLTKGELLRLNMTDVVHPDDLTSTPLRLDELREGKTVITERRLVRADGSVVVAEISGKSLPGGNFLSIVRDITERKRAEDTLRESEERFRQLTDNIREVFWMTTPERDRVLYVSSAYQEVWGRPTESLYDDPSSFRGTIHPEDLPGILPLLERCREDGFDIEYRIVRPDGEVRWVRDRCFPVKDAAGRVYRLAGIAEDVTRRKETEEALRVNEARLRAIFEAAPIGIALANADGRPVEYNPALEQILGYTAGELRRMSFPEFTHPGDVAADAASTRERVEGRRDHYQVNKRYLRKDGRAVWVSLTVNPVRDSGRSRFVVLVEDITARREAEEKLFRLGKAVEAAREAIGIADADRRAAYLNPAAEALIGYTVEELNAEGGPESLYADPKVGAEVYATLRSGGSWSGQVEVVSRNRVTGGKKVFPVRLSSAAIKDESGEIIGYFATWSDLREIARLEEQLRQAQKMEAVGQLAGGVAHDFNNLLTVITGYLNLSLKKLEPSNPLRRNLEASLMAAERAADLTHQLLAFGRKQLLCPEPLRLDEVVSGIDLMLRRTIGDHVELTFSSRPPMPYVEADRTQLDLVILNLALNARDAMPHGGRLIISTYSQELTAPDPARDLMPPGLYAVLQVQDTGHGMDAETRQHIFEPFFTTKVVGKGTGLGLSTVYGIVRQSGGYIDVESEVGAGTTFRVYLPVAPDVPAAGAETSGPEEPPPGGSETILLVDDDAGVRTLTRVMLEGLGYRVLEAAGAEKAIAFWDEHDDEIALLLADVIMPHVGGVELADALRQLRPALKVLFISGHAGDAAVGAGAGEKSSQFLQKPFTEEQLARKLRELLGPAR